LKYLESIKVVQFFLYEKQDFLVRRTTGIFGPNGSGKSSMLDAAQIALVGANLNVAALNAQADEKATTRTVLGYCLGQYGETPEHRVRDHATTYITLIWRDSETGEPVSTGVCLYAAHDREKHEVLGRYVLRGLELSLGDHLEIIDGKEHPREWSAFRQQILQRSQMPADEILFSEADRYVRALLLALRGSGGAPLPDAFTRALRFGLRMRFDKTVDHIVRNDVLEPRPTNIRKFKELTDSFRKLADLVQIVEDKVTEGETILKDYAKAGAESSKATTWDALALSCERDWALEIFEQASAKRASATDSLAERQAALAGLGIELERNKSDIIRLRTLREAHASHSEHGVLQTRIEEKEHQAQQGEKELSRFLSLTRGRLGQAAASPHLLALAPELRACAAALPADAASAMLLSRDALVSVLRPVTRVVRSAVDTLIELPGAISLQIDDLKRQLSGAEDNLKRAKEGRSRLSNDVQVLLNGLRQHGLNPVPVCDLVRISDPNWQAVIEGYLGPHREALLAPAGEEEKSFEVYRKTPLYGVKLGMESRQKLGWRPKPGSVAELIVGENQAAVAYLRTKFGELMRAETNAEALAGARTLTRDGMLVNGGDVDRIRPSDKLRIGYTDSSQREDIAEEIIRLRDQIAQLSRQSESIRTLINELALLNDDSMVDRALTILSGIADCRDEQTTLAKRLAESADEEYVRLGTALADAQARETELQASLKGLYQEEAKAGSALTAAQESERQAEEDLRRATAAAEAARTVDEYDAAFASSVWDPLLQQNGLQFGPMIAQCRQQSRLAKQRSDAAASRGIGNFGQFIQKYGEHVERDALGNWRLAQTWLEDFITRLKGTELVNYKAQMEDAYRTSQETFRTDVAVLLNLNVDWLERTIDRLNSALRDCPVFSNGERYEFVATPKPHAEELLKFVKNVAAHGANGDLFGEAGQIPTQFRELMDEKVTSAARSPLDDYREFFDFDIAILRESPGGGRPKRIGSLSKRLGPGSGGEHRAPLYVIAGAALASAYRLDEKRRDGMGLILLDEAFNKMDMTNIIATMRYLEGLGLQILMVSPGENLGTLTAFLHRYYDILRDPERNTILLEGHDVSEETRALFREDLPEFNPELVAAELRRIEPVASGAGVQVAAHVETAALPAPSEAA
jgi:energy-coupling factor transporter ATP-binding protein EcfA2